MTAEKQQQVHIAMPGVSANGASCEAVPRRLTHVQRRVTVHIGGDGLLPQRTRAAAFMSERAQRLIASRGGSAAVRRRRELGRQLSLTWRMTGLFLDLSLAELKTVDLFRGALAEMCGTFLFLFLAVTAIVYRTGVIVPVSEPPPLPASPPVAAQPASVLNGFPSSSVYVPASSINTTAASTPPPPSTAPAPIQKEAILDAIDRATATMGAAPQVAIASTCGFVLFVLVYVLSPLSGGHLNPAVSLGLAVSGKVTVVRACLYAIAQCAGAVGGTAVAARLHPPTFDAAGGAVNGSHVFSTGAQLTVEFIGTVMLLLTVFTAVDPHRAKSAIYVGALGPLAIGCTVFVVHLALIPITGTSINPARSLGPALVHATWDGHWVFWLGPLAGAIAAAVLNEVAFQVKAEEDEVAAAVEVVDEDDEDSSLLSGDASCLIASSGHAAPATHLGNGGKAADCDGPATRAATFSVVPPAVTTPQVKPSMLRREWTTAGELIISRVPTPPQPKQPQAAAPLPAATAPGAGQQRKQQEPPATTSPVARITTDPAAAAPPPPRAMLSLNRSPPVSAASRVVAQPPPPPPTATVTTTVTDNSSSVFPPPLPLPPPIRCPSSSSPSPHAAAAVRRSTGSSGRHQHKTQHDNAQQLPPPLNSSAAAAGAASSSSGCAGSAGAIEYQL